MRKSKLAIGSVVMAAGVMGAAVLVGGSSASARQASSASAAEFKVDPVHSMVVFRIGHLGVANFYGVFERAEGSYNIDKANPGASFVKVSLALENVDSGNDKRDAHLKSADFFNAAQFPKIEFVSKSVKPAGENKFTVEGTLTMVGVTKPVTAQLEYLGEGQTPQGYKSGFEATFTIKRSDFGMTKFLEGNGIGDEVKLMVAVEGKKG